MLNGYLIGGIIVWLYALSVTNRAHLFAFYYWASVCAFSCCNSFESCSITSNTCVIPG